MAKVKQKVKPTAPNVKPPTTGVKPPTTGGKPPTPGGKKPSPKKAEVNNIKGESNENIKKNFEGKTVNGKNLDDITADPKVKKAANKYKDQLKKIGIAGGSLLVGLGALMLTYGTLDPVEAIKKAMEDAGETFEDVAEGGANFFKKIVDGFKKFGLVILIVIISLIVLGVLGPIIFKTLFSPKPLQPPPPPPRPFNQQMLYRFPPSSGN